MESMKLERERGQILVQVALMVVVLFAFVALALDGGQIYAGRRRMQNAADAGALAGARAICFDGASEEEAMDVAREYAVDRNDSQGADVDVQDDITVTVATSRTLDTFFAGVIGINEAHVRAEAAARCAPLVSGGGVFPIAFEWNTYTETVPCNEQFLLLEPDVCASPDCDSCEGGQCNNKLDCGLISDPYMGTGNSGWLDLPDCDELPDCEEEFLPDYYKPGTCNGQGEGWAECWVRYHFPFLLETGDCVPTEHGWMDALGDSVNARAGRLDLINNVKFDDAEIADPIVNIILWEEWCDANQDTIRIAGFGCVELIAYIDDWGVPNCSGQMRETSVIVARRICEGDPGSGQCRSYTGAGGGGNSESLGVSLVR